MIATSRCEETPLNSASGVSDGRGQVVRGFASTQMPSPGPHRIVPQSMEQTRFGIISLIAKVSQTPSAARTSLADDDVESDPAFNSEASFGEPKDEVMVTRDRRLDLLVRQFDKQTTVEDDARLAILTQRLRRLAPSVPEESWSALSDTTAMLERVSDDLDALRAQFDL